MRKVYICKKCGTPMQQSGTEKRLGRAPKCSYKRCGCLEFDEFEIKDPTNQEWDDYLYYSDELVYLLDKVFNEARPKQKDYFGCIELCDLLKEKYKLDDSIYELLGVIEARWYKIAHAKSYYPIPTYPYIELLDGRHITYSYHYYSPMLDDDYEQSYTTEQICAVEKNPEEEIKKIIDAIKAYKPSTFAMVASDIDFSLKDMKSARELLKRTIDEKLQSEKRIAERNRLVANMTKPVENKDPNYIKDANCPNCHKKSVYRITNVKRGASIGLFGLFSKDIGKTMECRSCGYKW